MHDYENNTENLLPLLLVALVRLKVTNNNYIKNITGTPMLIDVWLIQIRCKITIIWYVSNEKIPRKTAVCGFCINLWIYVIFKKVQIFLETYECRKSIYNVRGSKCLTTNLDGFYNSHFAYIPFYAQRVISNKTRIFRAVNDWNNRELEIKKIN